MPFIVDDRFHSHAKTMKTSMGARGLWVSAGSWSADQGTDGRVPLHVLLGLGGTPEQIAELTAPGSFWEGGPEAVEFHDWEYWNTLPGAAEVSVAALVPVPVPGSAERTAGARKAALRRAPGLKTKVRTRDGDCCRYCGTAVRWGAGRAADSGAWDWVEPGGPASPENVVTACTPCHRAKAGRSLKDAGMVLLPFPSPQPRTPSCTPSELGGREGTPSGTPSARGRTSSRGKTAGQKADTSAAPVINSITSNSSSVGSKRSVPVQAAQAREDPAVIDAVIDALNEKTGRTDIGRQQALHAIDVILLRKPRNGRRRTFVPEYFRTVVLNEEDPYIELLPVPSLPAEFAEPGEEPAEGAHAFNPDLRPGIAGTGACLDCKFLKSNKVHKIQPPSLRRAG